MAANAFELAAPGRIVFGAGSAAQAGPALRALGAKRVLLVTGRSARRSDTFRADLKLPTVICAIPSEPTLDMVREGRALAMGEKCDAVVAFGGGSAVDAGKAIAALAGNDGDLLDYMEVVGKAQPLPRPGLPCIAIPTTAGTGAEVETASMITDPTPAKKAIVHPGMLPRAVIADPELTISLPARLTAATGMDALSHNLEALCVPVFNPMADAIALAGIVLVARHLPTAVAEPANIEARSGMMTAAIMGATSFCKGLGAMHALSHAIGALHERHHGLTNAVVMPYVLAFNRPAIEPQLAQIAAALKLRGEPFAAVHDWIVELRRHVGIPHNLTGLNLGPGDFPAIARLAAIDGCASTNPAPLDEAACLSILKAAA